jgi:hypothetical protein
MDWSVKLRPRHGVGSKKKPSAPLSATASPLESHRCTYQKFEHQRTTDQLGPLMNAVLLENIKIFCVISQAISSGTHAWYLNPGCSSSAKDLGVYLHLP